MRENESQPIFLGRISKFESDTDKHGDPTHAQIIPATSPDMVTRPFTIAWMCRGKLGDLHINDLVVCARFPDGSGIILCRADGESANIYPDGLEVDGDAHIKQTLTADTDVIGGGISLKGHTHPGTHGQTGQPG